jgi:hypothetical protein
MSYEDGVFVPGDCAKCGGKSVIDEDHQHVCGEEEPSWAKQEDEKEDDKGEASEEE